MSSSRGNSGETRWSKCSSQTLYEQLTTDSNSLKCLLDTEDDLLHSGQNLLNTTGNGSQDLLNNNGNGNQGLFDGIPGDSIGPDEQCRVFLKAFTATSVDNGDKRCQVLLCKYRPNDASVFLAGPALQGTTFVSLRLERSYLLIGCILGYIPDISVIWNRFLTLYIAIMCDIKTLEIAETSGVACYLLLKFNSL